MFLVVAVVAYNFVMQCNIDARGKRLRLVSGLIVTAGAVVLLVFAAVGGIPGRWPWVTGGVLLFMGLFQLYEGWAGWCALRAMGFKTKV